MFDVFGNKTMRGSQKSRQNAKENLKTKDNQARDKLSFRSMSRKGCDQRKNIAIKQLMVLYYFIDSTRGRNFISFSDFAEQKRIQFSRVSVAEWNLSGELSQPVRFG